MLDLIMWKCFRSICVSWKVFEKFLVSYKKEDLLIKSW